MRTLKYVVIVLMAALLSIGLPSPTKLTAQPGFSVSFQVFFNALSPYGRWSNHPQYGSVWAPSVHRDFHPYYTNGRWVMTEYGNTWVSDYDWGWAPFHYGRWFYDDYLGWAWVPDYTWGPGWVNWRTGGGYYGWAPLMPGINVRISVNLPLNFWVFVPHRHFMSARWHRYSVPHARVTNIYHQTTIINNYYTHNNYEYAYGPRSSDIQRHTNSRVPVYTYSNRGSSGSFRESVARTNNAVARQAIEVRERSLSSGPAVATPGSGRSTNTVSPNSRSSSPARTSTPSAATPRSSNPVATPAERESAPAPQRSSSPAIRSTTPERSAPANNSRVRESSPPAGSRTAPAPSPRTTPAPAPAQAPRTAPAPTSRPTPERTAPAANRSAAGANVSSGRAASSRPSVSAPARSSTPVRSTVPAGSSGRSTSGERGGRQ